MEAYILKSAACLALFYAFYKLILEQQAMHTFKRFYLLGSFIAAAIIPLIVFTTYVEVAPVAFTNFPISTEILTTEQNLNITPTVNYTPIIIWSLYGLGVLIFGSIFFKNLFQIIKKIQQNPKEKSVSVFRVLLQMATIPHTFFNYVFLNKDDYQNGKIPQEVLMHEEAHAIQKHSIDVLFIELLQVVFWFNPFIWLYKRSIKLNHEFLADRAVLNSGADAYNYSNILLAFSSNASSPVLANSIIHSSNRLTALFSSNAFGQVKKRLTVMKTTASKRATLLRSLLILPVLAVSIYGFSTTKEIAKISEESHIENAINISEEKPLLKVAINGMTIYVNDKKTDIDNFSSEIDAVTKKWSVEDFKLYRVSITTDNTLTPFINRVNRAFKNTALYKQSTSKSDFITIPPVPQENEIENTKTLDHIIAVAKKGGKFIYKDAEISSDEAIALFKKNPEINLYTKNFETETPITTFQDEPLNFDTDNLKFFKLAVDFNTIIVNGKVSSLETFKNDVDAATKDWTEKDFKQTQPRTSFKNTSEDFLNDLDREFKKTKYSKTTGGLSIFWPHLECKPEHLGYGNGYPIVKNYNAKNKTKNQIIKELNNLDGNSTSYRTNNNRATLNQAIAFVTENNIKAFEVVEYNDFGKKTIYLDTRKKIERLNVTDIPPPPSPAPKAPKVKKGEKSNIPPPAPKAPKVLKGEKSNIPSPPPPAPTNSLDYIIDMAKEDVRFQYGKKVISADDAINFIKGHPQSKIRTDYKENKPFAVIIERDGPVNKNGTDVYYDTLKSIRAQKEKNSSGYIEINGETYLYVKNDGVISYKTVHGEAVNEKGEKITQK
ncbi:hypothetical protein ULMS_00130 [Patiriisocius marinistellae]|uniref:Peptidase M56 domain-containing protein n=1 Tax=Patiriisocius marinistellae TaxID=2494560 RepID=A0A5J4FWS8_9FLAO|nr:M56 family metallopeptidase [Patiriisocius marinistellae]GEQ84505.1 hypothetical protein ULMS_00130 [Patiriisocius marinistellae]